MTEGKHPEDPEQDLDEAELAEDLEIKDAEEADAIQGGASFDKQVFKDVS
ncbi:MAG: hypothetical protein ACLP50_30755 [Solirubrobacteraceae bacterium]